MSCSCPQGHIWSMMLLSGPIPCDLIDPTPLVCLSGRKAELSLSAARGGHGRASASGIFFFPASCRTSLIMIDPDLYLWMMRLTMVVHWGNFFYLIKYLSKIVFFIYICLFWLMNTPNSFTWSGQIWGPFC